MSRITVASLKKSFDNLSALSNVNASIAEGEFVSLIGTSGCGKSTLLRIISGLLETTSGSVQISGESPRTLQAQKKIGFVFQDPALLPWRTVCENIRLPLEVNRIDRANRSVSSLLEMVGLSEFHGYYPYQLSGGMQQRVALARALVFDPPLLLMDEPFGALDEITRNSMGYELSRIWEVSRKTVLFVTHSVSEAIVLSDRVLVMSRQPGTIKANIRIDLPRPRSEAMESSDVFRRYAIELKDLLR